MNVENVLLAKGNW